MAGFYSSSKQHSRRYDQQQNNEKKSSSFDGMSQAHWTSKNGNSSVGGLNFSDAPKRRPTATDSSGDYRGEESYGEREFDDTERYNDTDQAQERQPQYSNGFTMVSPNEEKRMQLLQQAERNMQQYEQMKKENLMKYDREGPSAPGGPRLSKEELLRRRQESQKQAEAVSKRQALERQRKREQWAAEKRAKEEQEITERKQKARQQTERNEERERREHIERKARIDDDRRRKNLRFFEEKFKGSSATQSDQSRKDSQRQQSTSDSFARMSLQDNEDLAKLGRRFPTIDQAVLKEIYASAGKSFQNTVAILSE